MTRDFHGVRGLDTSQGRAPQSSLVLVTSGPPQVVGLGEGFTAEVVVFDARHDRVSESALFAGRSLTGASLSPSRLPCMLRSEIAGALAQNFLEFLLRPMATCACLFVGKLKQFGDLGNVPPLNGTQVKDQISSRRNLLVERQQRFPDEDAMYSGCDSFASRLTGSSNVSPEPSWKASIGFRRLRRKTSAALLRVTNRSQASNLRGTLVKLGFVKPADDHHHDVLHAVFAIRRKSSDVGTTADDRHAIGVKLIPDVFETMGMFDGKVETLGFVRQRGRCAHHDRLAPALRGIRSHVIPRAIDSQEGGASGRLPDPRIGESGGKREKQKSENGMFRDRVLESPRVALSVLLIFLADLFLFFDSSRLELRDSPGGGFPPSFRVTFGTFERFGQPLGTTVAVDASEGGVPFGEQHAVAADFVTVLDLTCVTRSTLVRRVNKSS